MAIFECEGSRLIQDYVEAADYRAAAADFLAKHGVRPQWVNNDGWVLETVGCDEGTGEIIFEHDDYDSDPEDGVYTLNQRREPEG